MTLYIQIVIQINKMNRPSRNTPIKNQYLASLQKIEDEELETLFKTLDENRDGKIPAKEIIQILQELRIDKKSDIVFELLLKFTQGRAQINFNEFKKIINSRLGDFMTKNGLKCIFDSYSSEGKIEAKKIMAIAKELEQFMSVESVEEKLRQIKSRYKQNRAKGGKIDGDPGNHLQFDEFYEIMADSCKT